MMDRAHIAVEELLPFLRSPVLSVDSKLIVGIGAVPRVGYVCSTLEDRVVGRGVNPGPDICSLTLIGCSNGCMGCY